MRILIVEFPTTAVENLPRFAPVRQVSLMPADLNERSQLLLIALTH